MSLGIKTSKKSDIKNYKFFLTIKNIEKKIKKGENFRTFEGRIC